MQLGPLLLSRHTDEENNQLLQKCLITYIPYTMNFQISKITQEKQHLF